MVEKYFKTKKGVVCSVAADYDPESGESPRSWSNLGTLYTSDRKHSFGDERNGDLNFNNNWSLISKMGEELGLEPSIDNDDDLNKFIRKWRESKFVSFPVSKYEHSEISLSIGESKGWDSGIIGYIFVDKKNDEIQAMLNGREEKRNEYTISPAIKKQSLEDVKKWAENRLSSEIKTLSLYTKGNVYEAKGKEFNPNTLEWEDKEQPLYGLIAETEEDAIEEYLDNVYGSSTCEELSKEDADNLCKTITPEFKEKVGNDFVSEVANNLKDFDGNVFHTYNAVLLAMKNRPKAELSRDALSGWLKDNGCDTQKETISFINKKFDDILLSYAKNIAQNDIDRQNLKYSVVDVQFKTNNPFINYLFSCKAKSNTSDKYAVWTTLNIAQKSLNNGHYNLTEKEADNIMNKHSKSKNHTIGKERNRKGEEGIQGI